MQKGCKDNCKYWTSNFDGSKTCKHEKHLEILKGKRPPINNCKYYNDRGN